MPAPKKSRTVRRSANRQLDFAAVREIARALPDVEEGFAYGSPALKVGGKLLACIPVNKSAEPGSLAVRLSFEDREALLAEAPDVYYVTDHYVGYNAVLVRLARVDRGVLRDLLGMAHAFVTREAAKSSPARGRRARGKKPLANI